MDNTKQIVLFLLLMCLIKPVAAVNAEWMVNNQKYVSNSSNTQILWDGEKITASANGTLIFSEQAAIDTVGEVTVLITYTITINRSEETVPSQYKYADVTLQEAIAWWNRIDFLLTNVVKQNADGSWGGGFQQLEPDSVCTSSHPLIREAAHAAMGYAYAYNATLNPDYREKAIRTLDWLLTEQQQNGGFRYYCSANDQGTSLYPTGLAGRALIEGYIIFGDSRYLDASIKAYQFEKNKGVDLYNPNYNGFPISHMAKLYGVTRDEEILSIIKVFTNQMISTQKIEGYWSDSHNQIYYYHMLMSRALIQADNILDDNAVSASRYRAVNYIITNQNRDGSMWYNPYTASVPGEDEDYFIDSIQNDPTIKNAVNGLLRYQFNRPLTGIYSSGIPADMNWRWREAFEQKPLVAGVLLDYMTQKAVSTPTGLISYWNFDGNTKDSVDGNDGINYGAIQTTGKVGSGVYNFGGSSYILVNPSSNMNLYQTFSTSS